MESITMGRNHEDQPSNSTEEADNHQEQDVVSVGRLYECIFCKRGFTTAQALGGHMNIHRKDRAKGNRPNDHLSHNSISSKLPRLYDPVFASFSTVRSDHEEERLVRNYRTCFSSTSSTVQPVINHENNHQDAHSSSLRLQFGWSHDDLDPKRTINGGGNEEDEVDLELRLGHDP